MRRIEEKSGKKAMRLPSEKQTCPRRGNPTAVKTVLTRSPTERGGKALWDAEQSDRHLARCWDARVTSESRLSTRGESARAARGKGSRPLCVAKRRREAAGSPRCGGVARAADIRAGALSGSSRAKPQRCRSDDERMQKHT